MSLRLNIIIIKQNIRVNMEKNCEILSNIWFYYFSDLPIEDYEYDTYGKLIEKIENKDLDFTKDEIHSMLILLRKLWMVCDETEIIILENFEKILIERLHLE